MDKWLALTRDMITLAMFIAPLYLLLRRGVDAWEKRGDCSVATAEKFKEWEKNRDEKVRYYDTRIEEMKKCYEEIEKISKSNAREIESIKENGREMLTLIIKQYKQ